MIKINIYLFVTVAFAEKASLVSRVHSFLQLKRRQDRTQAMTSASVLAELSVSSPQKLFISII